MSDGEMKDGVGGLPDPDLEILDRLLDSRPPDENPNGLGEVTSRPGTKIARWQEEWPQVLREIAAGGSLQAAMEKREIDSWTVHHWLIKNKDRKAEYDAAYTIQADLRADEVDKLADQLEKQGDEMSSAQVNAYRVAIDAKKWAAAIRNSRKYADRRTIEVDTPDRPEDAKQELERLRKELGAGFGAGLSLVKTDSDGG